MIEVRNLCVDLGEFVLNDITLNIEEGEYFIILGPTGAGKTVLLESIAGLYPIKRGEIWLRGKEVTRVEPEKRRISIVYQDHVLFPHLSVKDNIAFGLRMNKAAPENRQSITPTTRYTEWRGKAESSPGKSYRYSAGVAPCGRAA
jgi:molybdate transport system ATP-binding protein